MDDQWDVRDDFYHENNWRLDQKLLTAEHNEVCPIWTTHSSSSAACPAGASFCRASGAANRASRPLEHAMGQRVCKPLGQVMLDDQPLTLYI